MAAAIYTDVSAALRKKFGKQLFNGISTKFGPDKVQAYAWGTGDVIHSRSMGQIRRGAYKGELHILEKIIREAAVALAPSGVTPHLSGSYIVVLKSDLID